MHRISLEDIEYVHLLVGEMRNPSCFWQCQCIILIIELPQFSELQIVATDFYMPRGS